jgi:hypothetical protein
VQEERLKKTKGRGELEDVIRVWKILKKKKNKGKA